MAAVLDSASRITSLARRLAIGLGLLLQGLQAVGAVPSDLDVVRPVIPLSNGPNTLSLTAAPLPARAFLAHRDNANAHGFEVLTLYIEAPLRPGGRPQWQLVPVFDARDATRRGLPRGEHLTLNTRGGADCRLGDFRLLVATSKADALLILADRDAGDSLAGPAPVTFRFFQLRKNGDGLAGRPLYYFEFDREQKTTQPYCDVGQALQTELGVGPYQPAER